MDSIGQVLGPIFGNLLIERSPLWFGIFMGALALVAFVMVFKKITPKESDGFSLNQAIMSE